MTCAKQFWKKMYTGWVMSIERQGNQGSTIPDTMCVVPYIAFYVSVCYFTKTRSNLLWFWWLQNLTVHTNNYMLHDQLFLILSHLFFHNAIALPVLKFIFNHAFYANINCPFGGKLSCILIWLCIHMQCKHPRHHSIRPINNLNSNELDVKLIMLFMQTKFVLFVGQQESTADSYGLLFLYW